MENISYAYSQHNLIITVGQSTYILNAKSEFNIMQEHPIQEVIEKILEYYPEYYKIVIFSKYLASDSERITFVIKGTFGNKNVIEKQYFKLENTGELKPIKRFPEGLGKVLYTELIPSNKFKVDSLKRFLI